MTMPSELAPETTRLADPRALDKTVESLQFLGVEAIAGLVQSRRCTTISTPAPARGARRGRPGQESARRSTLIVAPPAGGHLCLFDADNDGASSPPPHGRSVTVDLVDPDTGHVIRPQTSVFNQTVNLDIEPHGPTEELVRQARAAAAPHAREVLGEATETIPLAMDDNGESPLSDLIADGQLHATRGRGAQLAISNPDSLLADMPRGPLDYSTLHTVQPYGDRLYLVTVTGEDLQAAFDLFADDIGRHGPAVSSNVSYTVDLNRPAGDRVTEILVDGTEVEPDAEYTVVVNEFLSSPRERLTVRGRRARRESGHTDISALIRYVTDEAAHRPGPRKGACHPLTDRRPPDLTSLSHTPTRCRVRSHGSNKVNSFLRLRRSEMPPAPARQRPVRTLVTLKIMTVP